MASSAPPAAAGAFHPQIVSRVVMIASTPYGYLHHRFQTVADEMRLRGIPVTYVEQTRGWRFYLSGPKSDFIRQAVRSFVAHLDAATKGWPGRRVRSRPVQELPVGDFQIIQMPPVIPSNRRNSPLIERVNTAVFRTILERGVLPWSGPGSGCVALVDNPLWVLALRKGDFDRLYYDCIDDVRLYAGRASAERFLGYERELLRIADGAFATAERLETVLREASPGLPVVRVPNGVAAQWFREQADAADVPPDLAPLPRPIIGYVGTISDWLDYDLVSMAARSRPGMSFVFVGPIDYPERRAALCSSPNVYWLGKKSYERVPAYMKGFDVCWIPFAHGPIVENTNPIKLFEYFAVGRPVVTTPMPEVIPFARDGLVLTGSDTSQICTALDAAIVERGEDRIQRRRDVALAHSWSRLVDRMLLTMDRAR